MHERKLAPAVERRDVDGHAAFLVRFPDDAPRERQPSRPIDLEIVPDVIDLIAGASQASNTRSGAASKRRITRTVEAGSVTVIGADLLPFPVTPQGLGRVEALFARSPVCLT